MDEVSKDKGNPPLSAAADQCVDVLFAEADRPIASQMLLEECGYNLPLVQKVTVPGMDRFRFAALKLSNGDLGKLRRAVDIAKRDWRDLLMAAGFGHKLDAHLEWFQELIAK